MELELIFLGTGTSQGIPIIGCDCGVCTSADPRDRRNRTSAAVRLGTGTILIDAAPELRLQCLANGIDRVDAVLVTHAHADHIFGLDDVRRFNQLQGGPIGVYADPEHLAVLENIFGYARADRARGNVNLPQLQFHPVRARQDEPLRLCGGDIRPLELWHGPSRSLGYRIGPLAYCTDLSAMPEDTIERVRGVEVLVLGALRPRRHATHLTLEQAQALADRIGARTTYFVHMSHDVGHAATEVGLPGHIRLAYDGLRVVLGD